MNTIKKCAVYALFAAIFGAGLFYATGNVHLPAKSTAADRQVPAAVAPGVGR